MSMPKAGEAARGRFHSLLPEDPRIAVRPMFGNLAAFVNGNMFAGIFGESVFVRLPEAERAELLAVPGADLFAPMPDRPMQEYVALPDAWREELDTARGWVLRSFTWAAALPAKEKKEKKAPKGRG